MSGSQAVFTIMLSTIEMEMELWVKWLPASARPLLSSLCRALTVRGRKGACSLYPSNTPSSVSMTQGFRGFKGEKGEPGQPGLDGLDAPCQLVQYPLFLSSPVHATILCLHMHL